jgi:hypothetical protein
MIHYPHTMLKTDSCGLRTAFTVCLSVTRILTSRELLSGQKNNVLVDTDEIAWQCVSSGQWWPEMQCIHPDVASIAISTNPAQPRTHAHASRRGNHRAIRLRVGSSTTTQYRMRLVILKESKKLPSLPFVAAGGGSPTQFAAIGHRSKPHFPLVSSQDWKDLRRNVDS